MGCSNFFPCPLHGSIPIWLIHFICGTQTTPELTMCRAPFSVKMSMVKVTCAIRSFCHVFSVAPSLFDQLTSFVVHTQPMRLKWCVVSWSKGQRSRSHWSFKFLLCPLHGSVPIGPIHFKCSSTTIEGTMCRVQFPGQKVTFQGHTGCSYINYGPLVAKGVGAIRFLDLLVWLGMKGIRYEDILWVIMRRRRCSQNTGILCALVSHEPVM